MLEPNCFCSDYCYYYVSVLPLPTLTTCLDEIKGLMKDNFLKLKSSKTEAIPVGTHTRSSYPP